VHALTPVHGRQRALTIGRGQRPLTRSTRVIDAVIFARGDDQGVSGIVKRQGTMLRLSSGRDYGHAAR
jgi:hypothetical protein